MYFFVPHAATETTVCTKTGLEMVECLPPAAHQIEPGTASAAV
jgi:hypothetical protein